MFTFFVVKLFLPIDNAKVGHAEGANLEKKDISRFR